MSEAKTKGLKMKIYIFQKSISKKIKTKNEKIIYCRTKMVFKPYNFSWAIYSQKKLFNYLINRLILTKKILAF